MKEIRYYNYNRSKYIPLRVIDLCFTPNKTLHIDKIFCGTGFTTGYFNLTPEEDKINVLIAPNLAVIKEKEQSYKEGKYPNVKAKFFYGESIDRNFTDANLLVFVSDSFYEREDSIRQINHKIQKVLIDEYHSVEQQSEFRYKLKQFIEKVEDVCNNPNTAITTVTATPNYFSKVDIQLVGDRPEEILLKVTKDKKDAIERIKGLLKNNENVILFTNDRKVITSLKSRDKVVRANFITGDSLIKSVVKGCKIKADKNSNLSIVSSRGFEGFDLNVSDANVFYMEDRSREHETFFISNLYQAINRNKSTNKHIEYVRIDSDSRKAIFKNIDKEVKTFIDNKSISVFKKLGTKYKKFRNFTHMIMCNKSFEISPNEVAIGLYKEKRLYDYSDWDIKFSKFLEDRNVKVEFVGSKNCRITSRITKKVKENYLYENRKFIKKHNLFGSSHRLKVKNLLQENYKKGYDILPMYLKYYEEYLIEKNYNKDIVLSDRQRNIYLLLANEVNFKQLHRKVLKSYRERQYNQHSRAEAENKVKEFKEKSINYICQVLLTFANNRISFNANHIAHRDYNLTVQASLSVLETIANEVDVYIDEIDIKTCNPRILYALCGLELPDDFYGKNKENKTAINALLNSFRYDETKGTPKKIQKHRAIKQFQKYGFQDKVIDYLIENYFETEYNDTLMNELAYYEKEIIKKLSNELGTINDGKVRRHDSLLIFNNRLNLAHLNSFEYLGVKGWFKAFAYDLSPINDVIAINSEIEVNDYDEFGNYNGTDSDFFW